jgi:hypothetical protein
MTNRCSECSIVRSEKGNYTEWNVQTMAKSQVELPVNPLKQKQPCTGGALHGHQDNVKKEKGQSVIPACPYQQLPWASELKHS